MLALRKKRADEARAKLEAETTTATDDGEEAPINDPTTASSSAAAAAASTAEKTCARILLKQNPLEWHEIHHHATESHLVIPMLTTFTKAVAIQAALIGHYKNGGRVNLWLGSKHDLSRLEEEYPKLTNCVHLHVLLDDEHTTKSIASIPDTIGSMVTVLMTHVSSEEGVRWVQRLNEELREYPSGNHFRVILQSKPPTTPSTAGEDEDDQYSIELCVPPPLEGIVHKHLDRLDRVARKVHETWYHGTTERIQSALNSNNPTNAAALQAKPTYKLWTELTEQQRDDNRPAADHIDVMIRAVNLDPNQPDLLEQWGNLSPEDLDMLSRMQHERWAAPLWLRNWEAGERDDVVGRHPDLIPYEELDEGTQAMDTEQVMNMAEYARLAQEQMV